MSLLPFLGPLCSSVSCCILFSLHRRFAMAQIESRDPLNIVTIPQRSCSSRMEMLVTKSIAVQNFFRKIIMAYCRDPQSSSPYTLFFNFWALICYNSWNSIQSDSLISTSLSGTPNNQAHGHFEAAEFKKKRVYVYVYVLVTTWSTSRPP